MITFLNGINIASSISAMDLHKKLPWICRFLLRTISLYFSGRSSFFQIVIYTSFVIYRFVSLFLYIYFGILHWDVGNTCYFFSPFLISLTFDIWSVNTVSRTYPQTGHLKSSNSRLPSQIDLLLYSHSDLHSGQITRFNIHFSLMVLQLVLWSQHTMYQALF